MSRRKEWNIRGGNKYKRDIGSGSVVDRLLEIRGITTKEGKEAFLNPLGITLMHPNAFCDMQKAVDRILKAIEEKQNILIYGDFDADGVTSTAVLVKTLTYLGANADYYIPDRENEGHGMNTNTLVKLLTQKKPNLIITVDNGISNVEEVKFVKSFGRDVIITDHHEAGNTLPDAYAIINPKAMNALDEKLSTSQIESLTSLAGVGVAFKLAQAVLEKYDKLSYSYDLLPFVAVGTVADLVPLIGENRYFVVKGMELISEGKHYGLRRLLETSGINTDNGLTSEQIAFTVAPRINASGRIENVNPAVKLLISDNKQEIELSIMQLDNFNKIRQQMVNDVFEEADAIWQKYHSNDSAVILYSENWHIGIIGIVASKFVEKYYKPAFIMNYSPENKLFRCSCRGVSELNLYDIISQNSELFDGYGGHKLAAGFTFSEDKNDFQTVKNRLNQTINEMLNGKTLIPSLDIDLEMDIDDVDISLVEEISKLEPFGMSNPSPSFAINNLVLKQKKLMGAKKEHLKLTVESSTGTIDCVWWSRGDIPLIAGDRMDIAFAPQLNTYNGTTSVQLLIKDIHSELLNEEKSSEQKIYDHRNKVNIYSQVNDYIKNAKQKIAVFAEDMKVIEELKPYKYISESIVNRINAEQSNVLMFFDYPAGEELMQDLMQKISPKSIHYMNYELNYEKNIESILKTFSGMVRYTCNSLEGKFNLERAAAKLSVTNEIVETILELFEDAGMIKITGRDEKIFNINFIESTELSKIISTPKYAEFAELMNSVKEYKNQLLNMQL